MKILIVSDSHGHNEIIDDLIRDNKDVDIFLHAGDSEVPSYTLYPFRVVRGNCDYTFDMPIEFIIPSPFGNILLRHKDDRPTSYLKEHDIKIYIGFKPCKVKPYFTIVQKVLLLTLTKLIANRTETKTYLVPLWRNA